MSSFSRRSFIVGCLFLGTTSMVEARRLRFGRGIRSGARSVKSYDQNTLSKEELASCLNWDSELKVASNNLEPFRSELETMQSRIETNEIELKRKSIFVDNYSQTSVDTYNNSVKEHRNLIDEYNKQIEKYSSIQSSYNHRLQKFNSLCANKKYYEDDLPK